MALEAQEFYSDQDLRQNAAQMRRALLLIGLPSLLLLAALVASLAVRAQWLTVLTTIVWGAMVVFLWDMKIAPVRAYRKHLTAVLSGLRRTAEGRVVSFSEEGAYKDGVFFDTLIINGDPKMEPEGERLFYVDRCKERPPLASGDFVRVTSNGNYVTAWEK
ncbi:MAG: hypothetical protein FWE77_05900 [Clostridia bacterium]|nr:hypothetical protein [Clostridia bacterium]